MNAPNQFLYWKKIHFKENGITENVINYSNFHLKLKLVTNQLVLTVNEKQNPLFYHFKHYKVPDKPASYH